MALQFKKATAVAVGTFNIYVIQPNWLTEIGQIEKGEHVRIEASFDRPGFRFAPEGGILRWDVRPDRLIVESDSAEVNCGDALAVILAKLPWTPLTAVGVNAEFDGDLLALEGMPSSCKLPTFKMPAGYDTKQRTVHIAAKRGEQVFNTQISAHEKVELSLNVHTELKGKGKQEDINRIATEVCRRFFAFREEATALAQELFSVELSYERNLD